THLSPWAPGKRLPPAERSTGLAIAQTELPPRQGRGTGFRPSDLVQPGEDARAEQLDRAQGPVPAHRGEDDLQDAGAHLLAEAARVRQDGVRAARQQLSLLDPLGHRPELRLDAPALGRRVTPVVAGAGHGVVERSVAGTEAAPGRVRPGGLQLLH